MGPRPTAPRALRLLVAPTAAWQPSLGSRACALKLAPARAERALQYGPAMKIGTALGVASLLLGLLAGAPGCIAATDSSDDGDDASESAEALSEEGRVEIVQFNPFYGGAYPQWAYTKDDWQKLPKTYATMEAFAKKLADDHPHAAVIGMQEILSEENVEQIRLRLVQATGKPWKAKHYGKSLYNGDAALPATQEGIFWRDDLIDFVTDFGTHEVVQFEKNGKIVSVRFGGALLAKKGTTRRFGFFTGKLSPRSYQSPGGKDLDAVKDEQVKKLESWIHDKMKDHPGATRVVAIDQNDGYGKLAFDEFAKRFGQGGDDTPTWQSPHTGNWYRYDYVWWDRDGDAEKKGNGFFSKPKLMTKTGSDHRAVVADVYIHG